VRIWADSTANGSTFSDWDGCDSDSGRRCDVDVSTGNSKTIRANYSSTPEPEPQAVLEVSSTPFSGVPIHHVHEWRMGPGDDTYYFREYDDAVDRTWIQAPTSETHEGTEYRIGSWDGCRRFVGDDNRSCEVDDIPIGDTRSITVNYVVDETPGCTDSGANNYDSNADIDDGSCTYDPAQIDNFSIVNDPDIDFTATPPEINVDDQPFQLTWSTSNADSVTASGDWNGSKPDSATQGQNEGSISGNSERFTYVLTAENAGGSDSVTRNITIVDPPTFSIAADPGETEIDGQPGSTAKIDVIVNSRKYSGNISLEVKDSDIPSSLKDDEGNSKIAFDFVPSQINNNGTSQLNLEVLQPMYQDLTETITITGTDLSGTAENRVRTTTFILNIKGFSPRTIEEF